jgi:hypothetical protein
VVHAHASFIRSPFVPAHLLVVNALCSNAEVSRQLGPDGTAVALDITGYLLQHDMYSYLATSLLGIVRRKSSRLVQRR